MRLKVVNGNDVNIEYVVTMDDYPSYKRLIAYVNNDFVYPHVDVYNGNIIVALEKIDDDQQSRSIDDSYDPAIIQFDIDAQLWQLSCVPDLGMVDFLFYTKNVSEEEVLEVNYSRENDEE